MDRHRPLSLGTGAGLLLAAVVLLATLAGTVAARPGPTAGGIAPTNDATALQLRQWAENGAEFQRFNLLYHRMRLSAPALRHGDESRSPARATSVPLA